LLGDLFDKPRDNPTWMIGRLIEMMSRVPCIGIYGNHDCAETSLNEHDSLSILIKAGCLRLVDKDSPWRGVMNQRSVFVGGSSYRQPIPYEFELTASHRRTLFDNDPFVVWLSHHDIDIAGYENGRFKPHEIENVDLLINGHIHRRLETVKAGRTHWMTPGNISRRSRSEACKEHVPTVLRIDVGADDYTLTNIEVPHRTHDEVFHLVASNSTLEQSSSEFVTGLAELNSRRTQSGAGLHAFLAENLNQFEPAVATEIKSLAAEITGTEE
jgi:DNA repair exonuclease SbcCD nuclease subunit